MSEQAQLTLTINAPAMPKGGGAIQSIGKGWSGVGTTGAAALDLPLPISKAPNRDLVPALGLGYSSDVGNSPFGIGWRLSSNAITLRTHKGVPKYDGDDQVLGPGGDVWMPEKHDDGSLVVRTVHEYNGVPLPGHQVIRYWPRVEAAFDLIEHWTQLADTDNPAGFWLIHGADGSLHCYGKTAASRRADANDPSHVAAWLLDESLNLRGEHVVYLYQAEVEAPVAPQYRDYRSQRYLRRVLYGNAQASANLYAWKTDGWKDVAWHFHLLFDYGERSAELTQVPIYDLPGIERGDWGAPRNDAFWNFAFGFELGCRRLCRQVLMFHQFPKELGSEPVLVQRLLFEHRLTAQGYTQLTAAHLQAYDNLGQTESRPPMEFHYSPFKLDPERQAYREFAQLPTLNDGQRYQLVDLYGEGMPGVLFTSDKAWYYREPLRAERGGDEVQYGEWALLPGTPLADSSKPIRQSLIDLSGDGKLEWLIAQPGLNGSFTLNPDRSWSNFVSHAAFPSEFFHPKAQLADLVGGGLSDLALIGPRSVRLYANRRASGFSQGADVAHADDALPLPGNDQRELVAFSDPLGSGTQHLIRIRHNQLECWPNLGHGRFAKGFVLCPLPFDDGEFDASRIRLADLDGSGAVDLIYLEADGFQVFMNQGGTGFSAPSVKMPWPQDVRYDRLCQVSVADLQGLGCSSLILSVPHMQPVHWRYDFVSAKPYLVNATNNNMGSATAVSFRSSAQEWLDEKAELIAAGTAPACDLPFAMHLVSQQSQLDEITGNHLTQTFRYRQGFYDRIEREFRGFGLLLQSDTEASPAQRSNPGFTAPILSKTWYHTGKALEMRDAGYYRRDAHAVDLRPPLLYDYPLGDAAGRVIDPDPELAHEMARSLSGSVLRSEVFAADADPATAVPYSVEENRFAVRRLRAKGQHQPYAVLQPLPLESITYHYESEVADDPLIQHSLNLRWDKFGNLIHGFVVYYARRKTASDTPPFAVDQPGDGSDADHENRWWLDAHDDAQQCWYLSEAKAEYRHLEDPEGWRLGLPYRQRGNALVLQKAELKAVDIHHQQLLEWTGDQGDWAAKAVLSGLSLQRYQDPATGQLLAPDQLTFNALPDYSETAELDASALSAYDKLRDDNGEMPFNLKEKLQSPEVGYHIMQSFLPDAPAAASEDSNDARDYLWSVRKGFPTYRGLAGFHSVEKFQQTRSHGITTVAYDEYACLCTAVTLPDGCTTRIRDVDYRSFLPAALEDPNHNTQEARYNAFGEVLVSSFYGTELGVDLGFDSLRDYQSPADRSPANALADKHNALGNYATATFSAPFSWMGKVPANAPAPWLTWAGNEGLVLPDGHLRSRARWYLEGLDNPGANEEQLQRYVDESQREPIHVATLQADRYPGDPQVQIRASIACQDGFGRSLQTKQEVEPGMAWVVNDKGELELDENGRPREAHAPRRWRVSERVEYNNKGETVRTYRPYFASAYRYINDAAIRQSAYHDQQFYDAAGRPTHTVLAKRMAQGPDSQLKPLRREQRYRCWYTISFDENDLFDPPPVKRRSL